MGFSYCEGKVKWVKLNMSEDETTTIHVHQFKLCANIQVTITLFVCDNFNYMKQVDTNSYLV